MVHKNPFSWSLLPGILIFSHFFGPKLMSEARNFFGVLTFSVEVRGRRAISIFLTIFFDDLQCSIAIPP